MPELRLLVLDAYPPEGRAALRNAGGTEAGELYARLLRRLAPEARVEIAYPADSAAALPSDSAIRDFDGITWTGSSLTIHEDDDPRVQRQIAFARAAYHAGVPSFGSCWAAQLAVVAANGRCAPSPNGREFGIARQIELSEAGRRHPLLEGKPERFDAFTSHQDEVVELGRGASLLASNAWSRVQAVSVEHGLGRFWATQYHPEYDPHEVASLCRLRADELIGQGTFVDRGAAADYVDRLEALHKDPTRSDLAAELGVGRDLLDPAVRTREVRNWIESLPERARAQARRCGDTS